MRSLTVTMIGNFQPGVQPFEARWSTEHQVALSLESLGHTVVRMQEDGSSWQTIEWAALRSDCLAWITTWSVDAPGGYRCLARLREAGIPSWSMHLDLWWGLQLRRQNWIEEPYFHTDYVFTADGGHQPQWEAAGINHIWLPPAIYAPDAKRGIVGEPYDRFPVIFVGSVKYPHPEWAPTRKALLDWVRVAFGPRFRAYGGGIRGQALADLYASATVVVGDSCMADSSFRFWSDRAPETLGRGGFLLHPYVDGMDEFYTDGEHLRYYEVGDLRAVQALGEHYLRHPEEAREIADRGQALVQARDSYNARMETVLSTVFDKDGFPRPVPKPVAVLA